MTATPGRFDLVAVMARDAALALPTDLGLTLVAEDGLALVLTPAAERLGLGALLTGQAQARLVARLAARQRLLEQLQDKGDVLPARPGQSLPVDHLLPALAANARPLTEALTAIAGCAQYQVTLRWDPAGALRRFAGEPELAGLSEPRALASAAEALRKRLGTEMAARIAESVPDHIALPLDPGPEMLANLAVLTRRGEVETLEAALEGIDGIWSDGLSIRMIGPLPPVSFAAFELSAPGPAAADARRGLGVGPGAGETEIRAALRHLSRDATDGAPLTDAADLLRRLARAREAARSHADLGDDLPLLRLLRDGDVASRIAGPSAKWQESAA